MERGDIMRSEKHGDVDLGILIGRLEHLFARIYPDARDISVVVEGVDFAKGLSDPYVDNSGEVSDVVADYVDRMNYSLKIPVNPTGGAVI
jgi:hypothetical protein